jgi:hypothetical protein
LNAAGTEAWITGYGYPILNNTSVWNAYVYKVGRAQNATPVLVATIKQAQIFSFRETEDGSAFYVDLFFDSGGEMSTCDEDIVDTAFTNFRVVSHVTVQTGTLCAFKNMSESGMRVAQRPRRVQPRQVGHAVASGLRREGSP